MKMVATPYDLVVKINPITSQLLKETLLVNSMFIYATTDLANRLVLTRRVTIQQNLSN